MHQAHARRGRPKGTGIDDGDRIARLVELIRVRPDLKPTTAIRLMGFSDPSAIRRLREKYKVYVRIDGPEHVEDMHEASSTPCPAEAATGTASLQAAMR